MKKRFLIILFILMLNILTTNHIFSQNNVLQLVAREYRKNNSLISVSLRRSNKAIIGRLWLVCPNNTSEYEIWYQNPNKLLDIVDNISEWRIIFARKYENDRIDELIIKPGDQIDQYSKRGTGNRPIYKSGWVDRPDGICIYQYALDDKNYRSVDIQGLHWDIFSAHYDLTGISNNMSREAQAGRLLIYFNNDQKTYIEQYYNDLHELVVIRRIWYNMTIKEFIEDDPGKIIDLLLKYLQKAEFNIFTSLSAD